MKRIMNNKLLVLLQQSVEEYKTDWCFAEDDQITIPQQITDRFAELIIKECLDIMEDTSGDLDFAIYKIKKEFGADDE